MRIKTFFVLGAITTLAVVIGLETAAYDASITQQRALEKSVRADELSIGIYQLNSLTGEYIQTRGDRPAVQWRNRHASLGNLIAHGHVGEAEFDHHLDMLESYHAKIGDLFDRLLTLRQTAAAEGIPDGGRQTRIEPIEVHLHTLIDAMASEADNMSSLNNERLIAAWQRLQAINLWLNILTVGLLILFGGFGAVRVLNPLLGLRDGLRAYAGGQHLFRFAPIQNDEIGEVKSAFNVLADTLSRTMISRDDLADEVQERRRVESELRRSEATLRAILDNMIDVFFRTDGDGRVVMVSRSIDRVLGYTPDQVLDQPAAMLMEDGGDWERLRAVIDQAGGGVADHEVRMRHRDGALVWAATSAHTYVNESTAATGYEGVFRSIDERKAVERALRATVALTQALINASDDAAILFSADGTLLAVNDVFNRRFSSKGEDLVGGNVWTMFPPGLAQSRRVLAERALATRQPIHVKDSRAGLHFNNSIHPIMDGDGVYSMVAVFSRDITDIVETESRINAYIAEITRSNSELEQFAYVASHDLREPLRMISSYLSLLERRYGVIMDAEGRRFLDFARDGAIRMDRLVLDLLELSRIERRGDPFVRLAVAPAVALAIRQLTTAISEAGAEVVAAPSLNGIEIDGDRAQMTQLFQNLIGNAVKYRSPDRRPKVTVSAEPRDDEIEFHVADNGIGIEPAYFERIFGIFQRLHTRDAFEGTGIGLAICRKIVERHGGRIWLTSRPGEGTTFIFTLPRPHPDLSPPPPDPLV